MADLFAMNTQDDHQQIAPMVDALAELDIRTFVQLKDPETNTQLAELTQKARASLVFWSNSSYQNQVICDQVDQANEDYKFIHILLDNLRLSQLPEKVNPENIIRLSNWSGEQNDPEWKKLLTQIKQSIRPKWLQEEIDLKNEDIKAEKNRTEDAIADCQLVKAHLDKEIADHNSFRQRSSENHNHLNSRYQETLGSLEQMQSEVRYLQENLEQEKTKSSHLSKQVATFTKRKYSGLTLFLSCGAALFVGLIGVYGAITLPLQQDVKKTAHELTKIRSAHASTLQTMKQLEHETKSEKIKKSNALSKLQMLEAELLERKSHHANALAKLKAENGSIRNSLEKTREDHRLLEQALNAKKDEVISTKTALTSARNELQKTNSTYQEAARNLTEITQQLEDVKKQLQVTKAASQQAREVSQESHQLLKKNAYREIANLKNKHNKELAALRRKIVQLQKVKAKLKPQNN